jgi:hypothetical protein
MTTYSVDLTAATTVQKNYYGMLLPFYHENLCVLHITFCLIYPCFQWYSIGSAHLFDTNLHIELVFI